MLKDLCHGMYKLFVHDGSTTFGGKVRLVSNRPHSRTWRLESAGVFFVLVVFHIFMLGGAVPNFHQAGSHGRQSFLCYSNKKSPFLLMQELFVFLHSTTSLNFSLLTPTLNLCDIEIVLHNFKSFLSSDCVKAILHNLWLVNFHVMLLN